MVQLSSIRFGFRWKQAFRGGIGAVLLTDAKDLTDALLGFWVKNLNTKGNEENEEVSLHAYARRKRLRRDLVRRTP